MNLKIKHLLLFIPVFAIFCYPIINSGYYGDDSLNSFIGSIMAERNLNLFDLYITNFKTFFPTRLAFFNFFHWVFLLFTSLMSYKLYISIIMCGALGSTYLVIKAIVKDSNLPFLVVIFTLLIGIQFREYGDPILVFNGATSISLILLNLSIFAFIKFLQLRKKIFLISALIAFTAACASYELMYPFFLIYLLIPIVCGKTKVKQAANYLFLFLAPVLLLIVSIIISRLIVQVTQVDQEFHKAYEVSLNLGAIFLTFAKQIVASLPLSNIILNPFSSLTVSSIITVSKTWVLFLALLTVLFTTVFYYSLESIEKKAAENVSTDSRRNQFMLAIFAVMLLVIPNGIIALSPKYQSEIVWGSGYASLYFGYFGTSILIALALHAFFKRFKEKWILLVISFLLGAASAANFSANNKTVEVLNTFWKNPRTVAEESLQRGIMASVESGAAYMFINNNYPWDVTSFVHKYSGKFLNQEQYTGGEGRFFGSNVQENFLISGNKSRIDTKFSPKSDQALSKYLRQKIGDNYYFDMLGDNNVYYFDYYSDSNRSGYALLADVRKAFLSGAYINGLASGRIKIYMRMPEQRGAYSTMSVTFLALDPITLKPIKTLTIQENQFKIISQGSGWKLVEIESDDNKYLIDVKSVRLNTSQKIYQTSLFPKSLLDKSELNFKVDAKSEILHVGFSAPFDSSHIAFGLVKLGAEFSIVLRAHLTENTVLAPYAHIVGNHPGKNNFEGFVIQKKAVGKNVFDLHIGDGTAWRHVVDFTLRSDKDTFVGVSVKDGKAFGVIDKSVFKIDLGGDIHDSEMPLFVGNYIGKDRPFPGTVGELLITNTALPETVLQAFSKSVQGN